MVISHINPAPSARGFVLIQVRCCVSSGDSRKLLTKVYPLHIRMALRRQNSGGIYYSHECGNYSRWRVWGDNPVVIFHHFVRQYEKSTTKENRLKIAKFYLKNVTCVNNWDLVDLSSHKILGRAIQEQILDDKILDRLAISKNMWHRRVAIISTMTCIDNGKFDVTLRIAKKLLHDKEDLTHKAVGWTLREVWKRNSKLCEQFLLTHYTQLPRTTLRYAIERMDEVKRKQFLRHEQSI